MKVRAEILLVLELIAFNAMRGTPRIVGNSSGGGGGSQNLSQVLTVGSSNGNQFIVGANFLDASADSIIVLKTVLGNEVIGIDSFGQVFLEGFHGTTPLTKLGFDASFGMLQYVDGSQGVGKILVSDATGILTYQNQGGTLSGVLTNDPHNTGIAIIGDNFLEADTPGIVVMMNSVNRNIITTDGNDNISFTGYSTGGLSPVSNVGFDINGLPQFSNLAGNGPGFVSVDTTGVINFSVNTENNLYFSAYGSTLDLSSGLNGYGDIEFTTGTGASGVLLPTGTNAPINSIVIISDLDSIALTNNIMIDAGTGNTINSTTIGQTFLMNINGQSIRLKKVTATTWKVQ